MMKLKVFLMLLGLLLTAFPAGAQTRRWGGYGTATGKFGYHAPATICLAGGNVWATDPVGGRIQAFSAQGTALLQAPLPPYGPSRPSPAYIASDGTRIFCYDRTGSRVHLFSTAGILLQSANARPDPSPWSMVGMTWCSGSLCLAYSGGQVDRYDSALIYQGSFTVPTPALSGLYSDGPTLWACGLQGRVLHLAPNGALLASWSCRRSQGVPDGVQAPDLICPLPGGDVLVSDGSRPRRYDASGVLLGMVDLGQAGHFFSLIARGGELYASEHGAEQWVSVYATP